MQDGPSYAERITAGKSGTGLPAGVQKPNTSEWMTFDANSEFSEREHTIGHQSFAADFVNGR
jgi:hypothetical protein